MSLSLLKRLLFISIGTFIGILILKGFYNKKNITFEYLPNARTLKSIRSKPVLCFSEEAKEGLKYLQIDSARVMTLLNFGKVNFRESHIKTIPCKTYKIEPTKYTPNISILVKRCDSISIITKVYKQ